MQILVTGSQGRIGRYVQAQLEEAGHAVVGFDQAAGDANPGRGNVAVSKGIWREPMPGVYDFVPTAAEGQSAQWSGINSGGVLLTHASDWANAAPSQGTFEKPTFQIYLPQVSKS